MEYILGEQVTGIGSYAFSGCSGLTSVAISGSVTSIGENAFSGCSSLNTIKVPVTDYSAFCNNEILDCISSSLGMPVQLIDSKGKEITEYIVPDGVTSIGSNAFKNCTGLTAITIAGSVESIGSNAFSSCTSIMTVNSYIAEPFNVTELFSNQTYRKGTLYVPAGTKELYIRFDGWREFLKIMEKDLTSVESTLVKTGEATAKEAYSLDGRKLAAPQRGMNILRVSDGTVKKVMVK